MSKGSNSDDGKPTRLNLADANTNTFQLSAPTLFFPQQQISSVGEDDFCSSGDDKDDSDGLLQSCTKASGQERVRGGSSSSDDMWGTVRDGVGFVLGSSSGSSEGDVVGGDALFIPDPIFNLDALSRQKPQMPYLSEEELPRGTEVWVVDQEDVETYLKTHWCSFYDNVCNGKQSGRVLRHLGAMTLVLFSSDTEAFLFALSIPRACLSKVKIEPYEGLAFSKRHSAGNSFALDLCSSCHTGCVDDETVHQYYETLTTLSASAESKVELQTTYDCILSGRYTDALQSVCEFLNGASGHGPHRIDGLLLRSRVYVFTNRFQEALADALECCKLEPQWVRGPLQAARAYTGLGQLQEANNYLRKACVLVPYSGELEGVKEMNSFIVSLQQGLSKVYNVDLFLDGFYRKHFKIKRRLNPGEVIVTDEEPLIAMASLFYPTPRGRCSVCYRRINEEMEIMNNSNAAMMASALGSPPVGSISASSDNENAPRGIFCSGFCRKRFALFSASEARSRKGMDKVRELVHLRRDITLDRRIYDVLNITMRLFLLVRQTHRSLGMKDEKRSTVDPLEKGVSERPMAASVNRRSVPIVAALEHLGVFPLVSEAISASGRRDLEVVYDTITEGFKADEKTTYTKTLFTMLYTYVKNYHVEVELQDAGKPGRAASPNVPQQVHVFYLPKNTSCAFRVADVGTFSCDPCVYGATANCVVQVADREEGPLLGKGAKTAPLLQLIALRSIEPSAPLIINTSAEAVA